MKNLLVCLAFTLVLLAPLCLNAVPGRQLEHSATLQIPYQYDWADLDQNTGSLWFFKVHTGTNGFYLTRFTVDIEGNASAQALCYSYTHPLPLEQDGGYPSFILAENETGKSVILQQNTNNLFFTIIENGADINTIVIPHSGITFPDDPLWRKVYCHAKPELVFISSLPNVWRIDLAQQTVNLQYSNLSALGYLRLRKFGSDFMQIEAYNNSSGYTNYVVDLLSLQNYFVNSGDLYTFEPEPIGENLYLAYRYETGDWIDLRWTYLMEPALPNFGFLLLYYGGNTDSFNYTPMHTFDNVRYLGNSWWLGICTDYNNIPGNRRAALFRTEGNTIHYTTELPALAEIPYAKRIYTITDNYYLTFHDTAAGGNRLHLVDIASQTVTGPDTCSVLYQGSIFPLGEEYFYYIEGTSTIHCYRLVDPSAVEDPNEIPISAIECRISPNPFKQGTTIVYQLSKTADAELNIYNLKGQKVKTISKSRQNPGEHTVLWDGRDQNANPCGTGIYFLQLILDGKRSTSRKLSLIR